MRTTPDDFVPSAADRIFADWWDSDSDHSASAFQALQSLHPEHAEELAQLFRGQLLFEEHRLASSFQRPWTYEAGDSGSRTNHGDEAGFALPPAAARRSSRTSRNVWIGRGVAAALLVGAAFLALRPPSYAAAPIIAGLDRTETTLRAVDEQMKNSGSPGQVPAFALAVSLALESLLDAGPAVEVRESLIQLKAEVDGLSKDFTGSNLQTSSGSSKIIGKLLESVPTNGAFSALIAQVVDPSLQEELRRARQPKLAQWFERACEAVPVVVEIIDLDHEGEAVRDYRLFDQTVTVVGGPPTLEPPVERGGITVGLVPGPGERAITLGLTPGEHRITVVHEPTRRHSELRVFVRADTTHRIVLFLRDEPLVELIEFGSDHFPMSREIHRCSARFLEILAWSRSQREVDVGAFSLARTESTRTAYEAFLDDLAEHEEWQVPDCRPVDWESRKPSTVPDEPARRMSWEAAVLFANWCGGRLPTEIEWECAASNVGRSIHPWGMQSPDSDRISFHEPGSVFGSPSGATTRGLLRMADGVSEWCEDGFTREDDTGMRLLAGAGSEGELLYRAVRGGASHEDSDDLPTSVEWTAYQRAAAVRGNVSTGVRIARSPYPASWLR